MTRTVAKHALHDLLDALEAARAAITLVGQQRLEVVIVTRGRISLQPTDLSDGASIAHALGCNVPFDHRLFVPGHTLWTGDRNGLEVQIRAELRDAPGAIR